jgi:hypothetical protein
MKFHENPSSEVELLHMDRRKGKHDEANSLFRHFANAPKNALFLAHLLNTAFKTRIYDANMPSCPGSIFPPVYHLNPRERLQMATKATSPTVTP